MGLNAQVVSPPELDLSRGYSRGMEYNGSTPGAKNRKRRGRPNLDKFRYSPEELAKFERFHAQYGRTIYEMAFHLTGNDADAKDLRQEVLVRVMRHIGKYEEGTTTKKWLYRITVNLHIDAHRRKARQNEKSLDEPYFTKSGDGLPWEPTDGIDHTSQPYEMKEFRNEIRHALDGLPEELRRVVILRDAEGFSYEEIAEITETPVGTVKSRLHRARRISRERLGPLAAERGYKNRAQHDTA